MNIKFRFKNRIQSPSVVGVLLSFYGYKIRAYGNGSVRIQLLANKQVKQNSSSDVENNLSVLQKRAEDLKIYTFNARFRWRAMMMVVLPREKEFLSYHPMYSTQTLNISDAAIP